jgi:hypothetical protein
MEIIYFSFTPSQAGNSEIRKSEKIGACFANDWQRDNFQNISAAQQHVERNLRKWGNVLLRFLFFFVIKNETFCIR